MISPNSSLSVEVPAGSRYCLIAWCSVVLLVGISGNILILSASMRYKVIRLNRVSVTLIKNIALSDLGAAVFVIHPPLVSLIYRKWPYGRTFCLLFHYMQVPIVQSAELLICALNISKLTTLIYPLRSLCRSRESAYKISALIWILSASFPSVQLIVDMQDVYYDHLLHRCVYSYRAPVWDTLLPLLSLALVALPNLIVLCTSIALLVWVKKCTGRTNKQGVLTALYVGFVYLVAFVPLGMYTLYKGIADHLTPDVKAFFSVHVFMLAYFAIFINAMSNPFVYYVSIKSFNAFVKRGILYWTSKISASSSRKTIISLTVNNLKSTTF